MIKHFQVISISFEKIDTEHLEQFVIKYETKDELTNKLKKLKEQFQIKELQYLSTCNRLMILIYDSQSFSYEKISQLLCYINPELQINLSHSIENVVDYYAGIDCFKHVFEVASSLKSMVLGEREILRQYRQSFTYCNSIGLSGKYLRMLEKATVNNAKEIYTTTQIGEKPTSIVSLAFQKVKQYQLDLNARILLIGSGETNTTMGRFLKKHGFSDFTVFNRSLDNAKKLSSEIGAKSMHLNTLKDFGGGFDVLICCTAATQAIITPDIYRSLVGDDSSKKLLIDLSIPNNIAKDVISQNEVNLINIDGLKEISLKNLNLRRGNVAASRIIINVNIDHFIENYKERKAIEPLQKLPSEIREIKRNIVEKVFEKRIKQFPIETQEVLNELLSYMEKKCIAAPIIRLKEYEKLRLTTYAN